VMMKDEQVPGNIYRDLVSSQFFRVENVYSLRRMNCYLSYTCQQSFSCFESYCEVDAFSPFQISHEMLCLASLHRDRLFVIRSLHLVVLRMQFRICISGLLDESESVFQKVPSQHQD